MKRNIVNRVKLGVLLLVFTGTTSCEYETMVDIPYPDEKVYLPAAVDGVYNIDEGLSTGWINNTPGQPSRFSVNKESKEFNVQLGVYRSGTGNGGTATATIVADTDTVTALISNGTLEEIKLLPADKYRISQPDVVIKSGENTGLFTLVVDLEFLKNNAPQKYAIGVRISTADREVNSLYGTAILLIDTKILQLEVDFIPQYDASIPNLVNFKNSSLYGESFLWNFGDGSSSSEVNPQHTYTLSGEYDASLKVTGIAGNTVTVTKKITITL